MRKNDSKAIPTRPARKPLGELPKSLNNITAAASRDQGVGKWSLNPATQEKKLPPSSETKTAEPGVVRNEAVEDGGGLDRLFLVQSDLSALAHQIEELVVQAFNLGSVSTHGKNEIDSFRIYLSDTLSSMKPWAARLQKALAAQTKEPENFTESSQPILSTKDEDEESSLVDSPEQSELDSLISPSPLVSWRANCTVDRARQLFLLTPLPISKSLSSKCKDSSISVLEKTSSTTAPPPSLHSILQETDDPVPMDSSKFNVLIKDAVEEDNNFSSPLIVSKRECSISIVTPCFKMSPPKSCSVLEPVSEVPHWRDCHLRKATPFPVGTHYSFASDSSESSDEESSDGGLAAKFPELLAIRDAPIPKQEMRNKNKESSPDWLVSPPKSCILMNPLDEKKITATATDCKEPNILLISSLATSKPEPLNRRLQLVESTPVLKEPESSFCKKAGENTLKKELWTRFEAASSFGVHLKSSVSCIEAEKFIDKLDEVSSFS